MWLAVALACRDEATPADPLGMVVNEVLSRNDSAWADPEAPADECPEFDDYVELYNASDHPIDLAGWSLRAGDDAMILPPGAVAPGGYALVVADEDPEQGPWHAPFGVSADGEALSLADARGFPIDRVDVPPLESDRPWGRYGDGAQRWRELAAPSPGAANEAPPDDPCLGPPSGFDDHTVPCLATRAGFDAMASEGAGLSVVKLDILSFQDPARRHVRFVDNRFYDLHDEYYLFRMLNGQPFEGETLYAPWPGDFATVADLYAWAEATDLAALFPPDFVTLGANGRLSSRRFYTLALGAPRVVGVGTLIHADATADRDEIWAFELEYNDDITYDDLSVYFQLLIPAVPAEAGPALRWLVRSPIQEELAQQMEAQGLAWSDRLLRYDELSPPGTIEVYHDGTVAGSVRMFRAGDPVQGVGPNDILVLEDVPDELPPCAALITSVPQTPLAHIALLAESRGIPNLHVQGVVDDPKWTGWASVHAPIALRAVAPDRLDVVGLSTADWTTWLELQQIPPVTLAPVDLDGVPLTVDLPSVPAEELDAVRPIVGGKSAGFVVLLEQGPGDGVEVPEDPLAITVRPYLEQLDALGFADAVLADPVFDYPGDPRGRALVLEGVEGYDGRYSTGDDATYRDSFLASHPAGTTVGDLARDGGVRGRFAATPVAPATLQALTDELTARFGHYAPTQGLRFRSSSNVEDAEGFVGAGLYESWTGYLDPEVAADEDATVDQALRQVWGSYWGVEALEERHGFSMAHDLGGMGVLVHANFADEHEISNGVLTATLLPPGSADRYDVRVNAQVGAISVTNPPVDDCRVILPEVDRLLAGPDGAPRIERLQSSTEQDGPVLQDAQLEALFARVVAVAERWRDVGNASLPPAQARSTLTLDFEYREVDGDWPELDAGAIGVDRLVLKQARSLEPAPLGLPADLLEAPFPRDVLARARTVTEVTCASATHTLVATEALTDPALAPDLGWSVEPFTAAVALDGVAVDHLSAAFDHPSVDPWELRATADAVYAPFAVLEVADGQLWVDGVGEPLLADCETVTRWASPDTFLDDLLP